jgi:cytochrome c oxidase subunit 4
MADHVTAAATHGGGGGHATVKTYINVAIALAIITAVEVATLYIPGIPNPVLVVSLLAMSAIKFFLVVGFFMHLRYDHQIMRVLFVGPLMIAIAIILAIMALFSAFLLLPRPH